MTYELFATLSDGWHDWPRGPVQDFLSTPRTYVIYVDAVERSVLQAMAESLAANGWYLGAAEIDRSNPLHLELTRGSLIHVGFFRDRCLFHLQQDEFDVSERWDLSREMEVDGIRCAWYDVAADGPVPVLSSPAIVRSMAGQRAVDVAKAVLKPTHHERILSALSADAASEHERPVVLRVDDLAGVEDAGVPRSKLVDYALNKDHATGKHKAYLFDRLLGIDSNDWEFLADQLRTGLAGVHVEQVRDESAFGTEHHIQYRADIPVTGRNGAVVPVRTVWKIVDGEAPSLVTLFVPGEPSK